MLCLYEYTDLPANEAGEAHLRCRNCQHERYSRYEPRYVRRTCSPGVPKPWPGREAAPIYAYRHGPGRELERLLESLGIVADASCGCKQKAKRMDEWGITGCREHFDEIVGWLREGAPRWKWTEKLAIAAKAAATGLAFRLNWADPFPSLVRLAIERAEELEARPLVERLNLVYHVLPLAHHENVWQWNVEQLLRRWHRFTGRKLITVATPDGALEIAPPEQVQEYFDDPSIEWHFVRNCSVMRDTVNYLAMLEQLESRDPREATFVAQAKGVTRNSQAATRPWTLEMYRQNLDRWDEVRLALREFPICGMAKMYGHFKSGAAGDWHYSGSFYTFRHDAWYSRPQWRDLDPHGWAIETHPAKVFTRDEAYCLAYDHVGDTYDPQTWRHVAPE